MSGESDDLGKLVESVADGESVDWDELERAAPDEESRQLIRQLRLIAEVAEVHRSYVDEVVLAEDGVVTATAISVGGRPPAEGYEGQRRVLPHVGAPIPGREGVWGHLLLVRKIGEGSYGEVYQAHDTWLDHPVALKLLKREAEGRVQPSDLLHEARKLARVRHTNVVTVHGADRHNGRVGFWMDFIDGETLASRVGKGRLSAGEAVSVGQEICRALAAVHRANIIHRDVKAQNVMRAHDGGRIILMDFGAGQFVDDPSFGKRAQGTPLYLAPELLHRNEASVRSDIYAVGVLLYHLVTGRFPVEAPSPVDLVEAHARGERRRLRDERPDLPDSFIATVERAIDPDPSRRYGSAGEMEAKLSGEPPSRPVPVPKGLGPPGPGPITPRQRRVLLWVGSVLTTVLALTLVGFITSTGYYAAIGLTASYRQESFLGWPLWGLRSLLPGAVLVVAVTCAGIVLFTAVYQHLLMAFGPTRRVTRPVAARVSAAVQRIRESPTSTTAPLLLITQCALVVLASWWFGHLLSGVDSLISQTPGGDLTALSVTNHVEHDRYSQVFSLELFVFTAAWASMLKARFVRRERGGWVSIVGGVAVTVLTLVLLVVPYRILVHNEHERVSYQSQVCYLLGERSTEALLFCTLQEPPRNRVVRLDDPELQRGGPVEDMFAQLDGSVNSLQRGQP